MSGILVEAAPLVTGPEAVGAAKQSRQRARCRSINGAQYRQFDQEVCTPQSPLNRPSQGCPTQKVNVHTHL